eukprot:105320-Chlamydomonas_euryale.AAC.1
MAVQVAVNVDVHVKMKMAAKAAVTVSATAWDIGGGGVAACAWPARQEGEAQAGSAGRLNAGARSAIGTETCAGLSSYPPWPSPLPGSPAACLPALPFARASVRVRRVGLRAARQSRRSACGAAKLTQSPHKAHTKPTLCVAKADNPTWLAFWLFCCAARVWVHVAGSVIALGIYATVSVIACRTPMLTPTLR